MNTKSFLVAAAVAGIMSGAFAPAVAQADDAAKVHCSGVNECKGKGGCKQAGNDCAGKNGCKGKGWVEMSAKDCKAKGGKVVEAKKS